MKRTILVLFFQVLFVFGVFAQNSFYENERNNIENRQTDETKFSKEKKKVQKFFQQNEFEKAEEFVNKIFQKKGNDTYLLLADNYFLKGNEAENTKEWETATELYNKAIEFYKKADYNNANFVYRNIGLCDIHLFKENHNNIKLIETAYENFQKSKSEDLIEKYDNDFVWYYFNNYTNTKENKELEKAFLSCNRNKDITSTEYKTICNKVADVLFNLYKQQPEQKDPLEKAASLYLKVNNKKQLNQSYKLLAEYFIGFTNQPEEAMIYVNKIDSLTELEKENYIDRINKRLIELCDSVDDCIKLRKRKDNLSDNIFDKAIVLALSIKDCDKLYSEFPENKSEIKAKALNLIQNVEDCQTALYYFPSKKLEIGEKAIELAATFDELGFVYQHFPHFDSIAEKKALFNIENIRDKREFVKNFPESAYTANIIKEIQLEEQINRNLIAVKKEINDLIATAYSEGKKADIMESTIRFIEIKDKPDSVEIPYTFRWIVHYPTRPMEYHLSLKAILNLKKYSVKIQNIKILMDDDIQDLDKFNQLKEKIIKKIKPIIYDINQLKALETKREVKNPLTFFYNFKKEYDSTFVEPSLVDVQNEELIKEDDLFTIAEKMPYFPGGEETLIKYLTDKLHYPMRAKVNGVQGVVVVSFIVEKDGSINNVRIIKGLDEECNDEAVKVIKEMPKWTPGEIGGKPVRVLISLPINFKLSD